MDNLINKNLIITERIDYNQFRSFVINCEEIGSILALFHLDSLLKHEITPFNVIKLMFKDLKIIKEF